MLVDPFTVLAQIINFLLLVWLLKRFLYKPVLRAIAERENRIAAQLKEAEEKKAAAETEQAALKRKNEEWDQQRQVLMRKALEEANKERERLLQDARKSYEALQLKFRESLREDEKKIEQQISSLAQKEAFAISRRILTDLASMDLEEAITSEFIQRLQMLKEEEKEKIFGTSASPSVVLIRCTPHLSLAQQQAIEKAVQETVSPNIKVQFEVMADLISGIEVRSNGYKLSWSIADYLESLDKNIAQLLIKNKEQDMSLKSVST